MPPKMTGRASYSCKVLPKINAQKSRVVCSRTSESIVRFCLIWVMFAVFLADYYMVQALIERKYCRFSTANVDSYIYYVLSHFVVHPDIRFDVQSQIGLNIHYYRGQRPRNYVFAARRKMHPRPFLPVGNSAGNSH